MSCLGICERNVKKDSDRLRGAQALGATVPACLRNSKGTNVAVGK